METFSNPLKARTKMSRTIEARDEKKLSLESKSEQDNDVKFPVFAAEDVILQLMLIKGVTDKSVTKSENSFSSLVKKLQSDNTKESGYHKGNENDYFSLLQSVRPLSDAEYEKYYSKLYYLTNNLIEIYKTSDTNDTHFLKTLISYLPKKKIFGFFNDERKGLMSDGSRFVTMLIHQINYLLRYSQFDSAFLDTLPAEFEPYDVERTETETTLEISAKNYNPESLIIAETFNQTVPIDRTAHFLSTVIQRELELIEKQYKKALDDSRKYQRRNDHDDGNNSLADRFDSMKNVFVNTLVDEVIRRINKQYAKETQCADDAKARLALAVDKLDDFEMKLAAIATLSQDVAAKLDQINQVDSVNIPDESKKDGDLSSGCNTSQRALLDLSQRGELASNSDNSGSVNTNTQSLGLGEDEQLQSRNSPAPN